MKFLTAELLAEVIFFLAFYSIYYFYAFILIIFKVQISHIVLVNVKVTLKIIKQTSKIWILHIELQQSHYVYTAYYVG